ncbi:MAG: hypothetical protein A2Z27_04075 [candidate division Zixibacteria bacterium RBG_16_50_21]|nr:MAG: hypothetical protein A2Z27_04075 [candidate division Zixibacteria bacterium RBG_16_50_21]
MTVTSSTRFLFGPKNYLTPKSLLCFLSALLMVFIPVTSGAETVSQSPANTLSLPQEAGLFKPNLLPNLKVSRTAGSIRIDGELGDPGWTGAALAANFCETKPGDQTRPPVEIRALVTYDQDHLYVAFVVKDNPGSIRASLRNRDDMFNDDYVGVLLDTYGDASWAYYIFCNPLGIQGDSRYSSTSGEDDSYDVIFQSKGKITDSGYQVEMAIPFRSLRFPDKPSQNWKANFWITHPRDIKRTYSWATINRDDPCFPCQFGTMTGIENVKPGKELELLPSLVGSQSGVKGDSGFDEGHLEEDFSLGLRYGITPSVTAEVSYNPDFSQVESDVAQIDVNNTFALFYPEKRPFFQEGSDLFDTRVDAVYTRSINNPLVAAKVIGRMGRTSLAYLGGRDESTPIIIPLEERSAVLATSEKSNSNILRFKQTFLQDSQVGALVSDRHYDNGGYSTVLGLDGTLRLKKLSRNYRLVWQALFSRTQEPDRPALTAGITQTYFERGKHTVAFDGESYWGHAAFASLERQARLWSFELEFWQTSPSFRADNGFVTRSDRREADFWTGLTIRPKSSYVFGIYPNVSMGRIWNFDGIPKDKWIVPSLELELIGQTFLRIEYLGSQELYQDIFFGGIRHWGFDLSSQFSDPLKASVWYYRGHRIARFEDPPVLGSQIDAGASASIKPWQNFVINPQVNYSKLTHPSDGSIIFEGYILRTKFNYQFTPEFYTRLVVQYDDFDQALSLEPLVSYKLNPFTIFYLGSTHQYLDLNSDNHFSQTSRQFFMKLQYLFRV